MAHLAADPATILLVDDSPSDRALLTRAFGPGTTAVGDAVAALAAVRRHAFAAIVLAQGLPRRSGMDLLQDLRADGDRTPVVLMLEDSEATLGPAALRAGAAAYAIKRPGFDRELPAVVARAVAAHATPEPAAAPARDVLVFEVDGQRHGLFACDVEAVAGAVHIAPVPGAPAGIEGSILYQGRLVAVVDLRRHLRLPPKALDAGDHLIVVRSGHRLGALRVDRADALIRVDGVTLGGDEAAALCLGGVAAVVRVGDGPVFVHELASLLAPLTPSGATP